MLGIFIYPVFLLAGAAALVPLILHLIQRLRVERFPFSTIRFLMMARKKTARRSKMDNLLLLFLRMLTMLLIAAAFAMPTLRASGLGAFFKRTDRDMAIVLDASYSMGYGTGADTAWARSVEAVEALLNRMGSRDRVCIFLAQDQVRPLMEQLSPDKALALEQVRSLKPAPTGSRLAPAILAARRVLEGSSGNREKEIQVVSDGQALPWTDASESRVGSPTSSDVSGRPAMAAFPEKGDIPVYITLTGVPEPENTGIRDVELTPPLILPGVSCKLTVNLVRTGPNRPCPVFVYVDDKEVGRRAEDASEGGAGAVTFTLPPMGAGAHRARVEIPPDNLPADNVFHFLVRVQSKTSSLCVGSEERTFFLRKALSAGVDADAAAQAKRIEAGALADEDVSSYACVFLCDALPLPGQAIVQLERYVEAGGLLVLFPGDSATVQDYTAWRCLPAFPATAEDTPATTRRRVLRWEQPRHAILRTLKMEPDAAPVVTIPRQLRWKAMESGGGTMISAGAGNPFLLRRPFGRGEVLAFSVSADRSWSSFPLSPYYLPLLRQIVRHGAGMSGSSPFLWPARTFALSDHFPFVTDKYTFLDPVGNRMPVRFSSVSDRTTLCVENLAMPGVHSLVWPNGARTEAAVAVNMPRRESDLTSIAKADLSRALGSGNVFIVGGKDELMRLLDRQRQGRSFGELLLWLALIMALLEVVYANYLAKSSGMFSAGLDIRADGAVRHDGI